MNKNITTIVVAVVLILAAGALYWVGSRTGPEEATAGEYDTFAQCLANAGMIVYGSATCKFCAQQRMMFGSSYRFIKEIECDPRNPHPEAELCIQKNIKGTPTWMREDANKNELYRFEAGVQQFERLAEVSGCPLVKDALPAAEK